MLTQAIPQSNNAHLDNDQIAKIDTELKKFNDEFNAALAKYNDEIIITQQTINAAYAELTSKGIIFERSDDLKTLPTIALESIDKETLLHYVAVIHQQSPSKINVAPKADDEKRSDSVHTADEEKNEKRISKIHPITHLLLTHSQNKIIWPLLIAKYQELALNAAPAVEKTPPKDEEHDTRTLLRKIFDVGKKLVDLADDVWAIVRNSLPTSRAEALEYLSALLIGGCGFIIHLGEGIIAFKDFYRTLLDNSNKQIKTKLVSNALSFFIACAGFAMAVVLFAHGIVTKINGTGFLDLSMFSISTVLVPGLLAGIYGLALWRKGYILHQINNEKAAEFTKAEQAHDASIKEQIQLINGFKQTIAHLLEQNHPKNSAEMSLGILKTPEELKIELVQTTQHLFSAYEQLRYLQLHADELIARRCEKITEKALAAEREVGFTVFEVIGSILVTVGIIVGTTALIGGTGGAALPLICVGVGIGFFTKLFEVVNEKYEFEFTNTIRAFLFRLLGIEHAPRHRTYESIPQSLPELTANVDRMTPPHSPRTPIDLDLNLDATIPPTSSNAPLESKSEIQQVVAPEIPTTVVEEDAPVATHSDHNMFDSMTQTLLNGAHPHDKKKGDGELDSAPPEPTLAPAPSRSITNSQ